MGSPTIIRWDTPGAPTLTRRASALIQILDFCLPQRGWEKVLSGVDSAVYRPGSGDRKFYKILNDGSFYYSAVSYQFCTAKVSIYDTMTTLEDGAGLTGPGYLSLAIGVDNTTVRPWVMVFDEKGFYFLSLPHLSTTSFTIDTALVIPQYVGETVPGLPGNTSRHVIAGCTLTLIPYYGSTLGCIGNNGGIFVNRSLDGTRTNINSKMQRNGGEPNAATTTAPYGNSMYSLLPYPYNGELLLGQPMLDDAVDYSMGDYIPGLYYPCHKGHMLESFKDYTFSGRVFRAFRMCASNANLITQQTNVMPNANVGACLIEVSEGFRP